MEFRIDFKETGIWAGSNTNFSIMAFHKRTKLSCCFCGTTTGSEEEQWRLCFFFFGRVPVKPSLLNLSNKQGSVVFQHVGWKDGPAGLGGGGPTWRFPQTHLLVLYLHCCGLVYFMSCPLSLIDEHRQVIIISSGLGTVSENLIVLFDSPKVEWPSQWGLFLASIYLLNRVYSDKVDDF